MDYYNAYCSETNFFKFFFYSFALKSTYFVSFCVYRCICEYVIWCRIMHLQYVAYLQKENLFFFSKDSLVYSRLETSQKMVRY